MRGEADRSILLPKSAAALSGEAYGFSTNTRRGETMSVQMRVALRETARDFAMVGAFGFWAVVIGFMPVVAIHVLTA